MPAICSDYLRPRPLADNPRRQRLSGNQARSGAGAAPPFRLPAIRASASMNAHDPHDPRLQRARTARSPRIAGQEQRAMMSPHGWAAHATYARRLSSKRRHPGTKAPTPLSMCVRLPRGAARS